MKINFPLSAVLLSFTAVAGAQATQSQAGSTAKPSAYGSAYQGVSQPSDAPILADDSVNNTPAALTPAAPRPVPMPPPVAQAAPAPPAAALQNPDYGIVETPVPDDAAITTQGPRLQSHVVDPDAGIVTAVQDSPNQLPEGTPIHARLLEEISGDTVTAGTPFSAQLTENVMHMGVVVIPVGAYIHGRVAYVSAGSHLSGQSTMKLRPEEVVLPDGTHCHFRGIVTQTTGSDTKANAEGEVVAKGHPVRTAAEYGMSAGSGAVIGSVVAGPVGAVTGAGIGAGLMTVHWLREKNAPVLPVGSQITFALSSPIALSSTASTAEMGMTEPAVSPQAAAPQAPVSTYVEPKIQN